MKKKIFPDYPDVLPLAQDQSRYARHISVTSCPLDDATVQVRGELVDSRADYADTSSEIPVHGIVIRLAIALQDLTITAADISLPKTAFGKVCQAVPHSAEPLIGLSIGRKFLPTAEQIYAGDRSCYHIYSLLSAMHPTFMQVRHWNSSFPVMDSDMVAGGVPAASQIMKASMENSCHAWRSDGAVVESIDKGRYDMIFSRIAPRLLERWHRADKDSE